MDDADNRIFLLEDNQPSSSQERHYQGGFSNSFLAFQHRLPDYLISPGLGPKNHQAFGLSSPSLLQNTHFQMLEEDQASSIELDSSTARKKQEEIQEILKLQESPMKKRQIHEIQTSGRTPKQNREDRKRAKGLRALSQCVYDIVLEQKKTTYKEVANKLVSKFSQHCSRPRDAARDQQNIKRRVYDALNVLISASVLRKSDKQVSISQDSPHDQDWQSLQDDETLKELKEKIKQRDEILQDKQDELGYLQKKLEFLKSILSRNKKKKYRRQEKVKLPIIGLTHSSKLGISDIFHRQRIQQKQTIIFNPIENIYGDLDLITTIDVFSHGVEEVIQSEEEQLSQ